MTDQPIVNTTTGTLRGRAEDGLLAFRGIPYAAPPVGAARWQAARAHPGWTGVRDATQYGPSAPQPWLPGGSPVIGTHEDPPYALRSETWENLIAGTIGVLGEYAEFGEWSLAYRPVIDDATMPRHPIEALTDTGLELMIGWTRDEASFTFALDPQYAGTSSEQVTEWAAKRHPARAEDLYHTYAAAHPGRGPAGVLSQIVTDELFRCGGLRVAAHRARTRPVRVYQFEVTSPLAAGALGATHCLELPFTFANMNRWAGAPFIRDLREDVIGSVTGALHDAWIAFVRHGDPSHPGIPPWEPYDVDGRTVLVIADDGIRVVPGLPVPDACAGGPL